MNPTSHSSSDGFPYEDIIKHPRPVSKNHPRMSITARAAQFSPFAALTGHSDAIEKTRKKREFQIDHEIEHIPEDMDLMLNPPEN